MIILLFTVCFVWEVQEHIYGCDLDNIWRHSVLFSHPFIRYLNHLLFSCSGPREAGGCTPTSQPTVCVTPSPSQIKHVHTPNHTYNLELPFHLTCRSADSGRKMVHVVDTHADTGKTCRHQQQQPLCHPTN